MLDTETSVAYQNSKHKNPRSIFTAEWQSIPFDEFLYYCATGKLREGVVVNNDVDMAHYRDRFIQAGINELTHSNQQEGWVQLNLMTDSHPSQDLYQQLKNFFSKHLNSGLVKNTFFMHKPPGIRIRLQATQPSHVKSVKQAIISQVQDWKNQQLIAEYQYAIYEPEVTLFGGSLSMPWIHALFTVDSLYWLDVHSKSGNKSPIHHLTLSLILLRHLFLALQIVDWEDLDVWNKVSEKTGRSLPMENSLEQGILKEVQKSILDIWNEPSTFLAELAIEERNAIQALIEHFNELCLKWRENYFQTEHASIGPRSAAAAYLIFFWNRANINFEQQRISTYALSHRNVLS